ncbi:MAG: Ig-like domain-containing protein [Nocardioides sp.]
MTLTEPINGDQVSGSVPLRWTPIPYAAEYEVQVFKNGDTTGSTSNLVDSGKTKQPAIGWKDPMPAASSFYTWRVRPIDVDKHLGRWTDLADPTARFYVTGTAPQQLDPAPDVFLPKDDTLFTWDAVDAAASYKYERRRAGAATPTETVNTVALGWAPRTAVPDGDWEWRVASVDAAGKVLGWSDWRMFSVDATAPKVTQVKPTGKVKRGANFLAYFSEPVTNVTAKTYFIQVTGTRKKLLATVSLNATGTRAKLNPTANLKSGKRYTITLTKGIKDANGNALAKKTWTVTAK